MLNLIIVYCDSIRAIIVLGILIIISIVFPFLKRNNIIGIRTNRILVNDEIWHKTHLISAIFNIPFILIQVLIIIFFDEINEKIFSIINLFIECLMCIVIQYIISRKTYNLIKKQVMIEKNRQQKEDYD